MPRNRSIIGDLFAEGLQFQTEYAENELCDAQLVTRSEWILKALNHTMKIGCDIVNISHGSLDFSDDAFSELLLSMSRRNMIVVSAAGNSGPLYGYVSGVFLRT